MCNSIKGAPRPLAVGRPPPRPPAAPLPWAVHLLGHHVIAQQHLARPNTATGRSYCQVLLLYRVPTKLFS